jgi:hypothetical protein
MAQSLLAGERMMPKRSILGAAFAVLALSSACTSTIALPDILALSSACTSTIALPDTNKTSSTGGTGATSGTGGAGGTTSTSSTGGSTGTAGSGGSITTNTDCEAWVDMKGNATQTIRFLNQTGHTIYLPTLCDGRISFDLTDASSPAGPSYVYDTSCLQTCAQLQTQPPIACGVCEPRAIRLLAGEVRSFPWDGTTLENVMMLPSCYYTQGSGICPEIREAAPGAYTASASAYDDCQGGCSCDAQGTCTGTPSGASTVATVSFMFPTTGSADVVFQP